MKRFDHREDIGFRFSRHWDQECGSCVHPRMYKVEVTESIRRQPDGRHNHVAFLCKQFLIVILKKNQTKNIVISYSINYVTDKSWITLWTSWFQYGIVDLEDRVTIILRAIKWLKMTIDSNLRLNFNVLYFIMRTLICSVVWASRASEPTRPTSRQCVRLHFF